MTNRVFAKTYHEIDHQGKECQELHELTGTSGYANFPILSPGIGKDIKGGVMFEDNDFE